jgi:hypothetical protein
MPTIEVKAKPGSEVWVVFTRSHENTRICVCPDCGMEHTRLVVFRYQIQKARVLSVTDHWTSGIWYDIEGFGDGLREHWFCLTESEAQAEAERRNKEEKDVEN